MSGNILPRAMQPTEEQKKLIQFYGTLQFSMDEAALMMDIDPVALRERGVVVPLKADADENDLTILFYKARLKEQLIHRQAIAKAARAGDVKAQQTMLKWAEVSESKE
jgi:hypothetical protein